MHNDINSIKINNQGSSIRVYFQNNSAILSTLPFKRGIKRTKAIITESEMVDFFAFLFFSVSVIADIIFSSAISFIVLV